MLQDLGIAVLESAVKACSKEIEKHKGKLLVKEAPRAVRVLFFHFTCLQPISREKGLLFKFQLTSVSNSLINLRLCHMY
jgi:hypothetical protein